MQLIDWIITIVPVAFVMWLAFYVRKYIVGVSDYLYEDVEIQAEKYNYGFVKLEKGESDKLSEQLPYINSPLVLCGDKEECEKFAYSYAGKIIII